MASQDFTTTITVAQSPGEVFGAINDVRGWWTGDIDGDSHEVGDEFTYRYPGAHYSRQRVTELVPGQRIVWRVVDSHLDGFDNPSEWTGTDIVFDLTPTPDGTDVSFRHVGLVPDFECYDNCSNAWRFLVNASLSNLISTGEGPTALSFD